MSLKQILIRTLDRPGGRSLLGKLATLYARRTGGFDIEIFYDQCWTRRIGSTFFADSPRFDYYSPADRWRNEADRCLRRSRDFWCHAYNPRQGDVVIDIGAGRGEDVLALSRHVGETGRVVAIEAHPATFISLRRFCELNKLSNVLPLHLALLDRAGSVVLNDSEAWRSCSVAPLLSDGLEVATATFDEVCRHCDIKHVSLLKMNIEGAEREALQGMSGSIERVDNIVVACHDFRAERGDGEVFRTRDFVIGFLQTHGFRIFQRPDDHREFVRDYVYGYRESS